MTSNQNNTHNNPGHETKDARIGPILMFGLLLVVVGVILHGVVAWVLGVFSEQWAQTQPHPPPIAQERTQFPLDLEKIPEPRLQESETRDLKTLKQENENLLNTYGWKNPKKTDKKFVRIPIDRAMKILPIP